MIGDARAMHWAAAAEAVGIREGQVLVGKYRVERVLGAGGMGLVVAARHLQLDERVAIKLLHAHAQQNPKTLTRFAREARAAAKIKSEHAAWVSDVGTLENGTPYMVMEHLEGDDLASWLRQRGPLPWTQAIDFLLQACEALAVAHSSGIVHRDLKPANLFVTRRLDGTPCVKVLDFGISRVESDVSMTQTAQVLGSPLYMSPEQLAAPESVDARSDIWSLGVILFELVSGSLPFTAATLPDLVAQIMTQPPAALSFARGEGATALDRIVRRCLEKDRALRYPSVAELARALHPFARGAARLSCERIAKILNAPPPSSDHASLLAETIVPPRGSKRALGVGLGLLLVAVVAFAFAWSKRAKVEESPPPPASVVATRAPVAPTARARPPSPAEPVVEPVLSPPINVAQKREPRAPARPLARPTTAEPPSSVEKPPSVDPPREAPSSRQPERKVDPFEDRK
ncbi:MAG TPA: protein kinase [Polyangiaceae bacterium]|nr:protein kinase [Polyangiaceae bacterium]